MRPADLPAAYSAANKLSSQAIKLASLLFSLDHATGRHHNLDHATERAYEKLRDCMSDLERHFEDDEDHITVA